MIGVKPQACAKGYTLEPDQKDKRVYPTCSQLFLRSRLLIFKGISFRRKISEFRIDF